MNCKKTSPDTRRSQLAQLNELVRLAYPNGKGKPAK